MKNRHKFGIVIIALALIVIYLIIWIIVSYCTRYNFAKDYYYSNKENFSDISSSFKKMYSNNLCNAKFDNDKEKLNLHYKYTNENNDLAYSSEVKDCSRESFSVALNQLKEQYQVDSDYPVFSSVNAYYDNSGNMLLYIQVKKKSTKNIKDEQKVICYYLVYVDEEYSGNDSLLGIDKFGVTCEPFMDNWCVWSETQLLN